MQRGMNGSSSSRANRAAMEDVEVEAAVVAVAEVDTMEDEVVAAEGMTTGTVATEGVAVATTTMTRAAGTTGDTTTVVPQAEMRGVAAMAVVDMAPRQCPREALPHPLS
mmetsp:Transcript_13283/g.28708  ORF Transcript_13283/g.28708 Transcript_13283/m.28708 type:complete len:109 (-) Transcript_13283:978-1304(-)